MQFLLLSAIVLSVCVVSAENNQWTMEIPDKVTGRRGNSLFLFCSFTHPFREYKGNISIIWKNGKRNVTFLNYTNYQSARGFENHIWQNRGSRYQILGDPRKNNATIIIKQLTAENGKTFICEINFTEEKTGKFEAANETIKVEVEDAGESSVIVKRGDSATLPCNFTLDVKKPSSISIIWMKGNPPSVSIVFNQTRFSSASPPYTNTVNEGDRYELVGDPEQGDASIRVTDVRLNDANRYFCHVWFKKSKTRVFQEEMLLQVDVPPSILSLSLATDDTGDTLVCRAEGKPPPNITWTDLENSTRPMNSRQMRATGDLESVGKLALSGPRGSYRCVAANEHRRDTREIHLAKTGTSALMLALFVVLPSLAIVPLIVFVVWSLKKGSCQHGWRFHSSAASGVKSQTQPDLQLESDPIYSIINSTAETIPQVASTPGQNDPQESLNQHLYGNVNFQTDSQTKMDPQEDPHQPVYSIVQIQKRSKAGQQKDPHGSPSHGLNSNDQLPTQRHAETAAIYAAVVHSTEQSSDLNDD